MKIIQKYTTSAETNILAIPEHGTIMSYVPMLENYFKNIGSHGNTNILINPNSVFMFASTCKLNVNCSRCRKKSKTYKLVESDSNIPLTSGSCYDFKDLCDRSDIILFNNGQPFGNYCSRYNILYCIDICHSPGNEEIFKSIFEEIIYFNILRKIKEEIVLKDNKLNITLGSDPEFETVVKGRILNATDHRVPALIYNGINCIGVDGSGKQRELRVPQSTTPKGFVNNLKKLFEISHEYEELSIKGNKFTLGGHIHIGGIEPNDQYIKTLDHFLSPLDLLNSKIRKNSRFGKKSDIRQPSYGIEYRTPPVGWMGTPKLAMMTLTLIKRITSQFYKNKKIIIHYEATHSNIRKDMRMLGCSDKFTKEFFEEIKYVKNNSNKFISELWDIKEKTIEGFVK